MPTYEIVSSGTYVAKVFLYIYIYIYPNTAKHQSKPQVYKSDIAPCGQI